MNGVKSYANSYLYTKIPDYEKSILAYVMKADRIDKSSEAFSPIIGDVKRRQSSAVLSRILMREDVVLATFNKPLPAAFKVFACKDVRTDSRIRVFIDCTGLITEKNGFLNIIKIDILCTYLFDAMSTLVYTLEPMRITTNASVIQYGTECFVSLASHIFDYLRPNGYAENKNKIAYIFAVYFQVSVLGLNRSDSSVRNLAAKVSQVQMRDITAMEYYYDDEDLVNIHTIITSIANTFKLKGVSTDVFIEKWTWFYGIGTQFATELFNAFSAMLTDAYCGSYINNQKTIEKCCARSMVDFSNAMLRIGGETFDKGFRYESSLDREVSDNNKTIMQESVKKLNLNKNTVFTLEDYENSELFSAKINYLAENAYSSNRERTLKLYGLFDNAITTLKPYYINGKREYKNNISTVIESISPYMSDIRKNDINNILIEVNSWLRRDDSIKDEYKTSILDDIDKSKEILFPPTEEKDELSDTEIASTEESSEIVSENIVDDVKKKTADVSALKAQWKAATNSFVEHKWVTRYIDEVDKKKLMNYYDKMCNDDISYSEYRRYFKQICRFMRVPDGKIIIENLEIRKDDKDKEQDIIAMRYSKGQVKVEIPEGVRLIHVSPTDNINSLNPSFRSKLKGRFLYPTKRVFFTVQKEIKPNQAALEKTKTTRYTPTEDIKYAYIDPTYSHFSSGSVFVETLKPIPVQKYETFMQKLFDKVKGNKKEE